MGAHTRYSEIAIFEVPEPMPAYVSNGQEGHDSPSYYEVVCDDPEKLNAHVRATLVGALANGTVTVAESTSLQDELTPPEPERRTIRLSGLLASRLFGPAYYENLDRFRADFGMPDDNEPLFGDSLFYVDRHGLTNYLYDDVAFTPDGRLHVKPTEWDGEPEFLPGNDEELCDEIELLQERDIEAAMGLRDPSDPDSWLKDPAVLSAVEVTVDTHGVRRYVEKGTIVGEFPEGSPDVFVPKMTRLARPHYSRDGVNYRGLLRSPVLGRLGDVVMPADEAQRRADHAYDLEVTKRRQQKDSI